MVGGWLSAKAVANLMSDGGQQPVGKLSLKRFFPQKHSTTFFLFF